MGAFDFSILAGVLGVAEGGFAGLSVAVYPFTPRQTLKVVMQSDYVIWREEKQGG